MLDVKSSALWAISGIVIGFVTIVISVWFIDGTPLGYRILVGPGIYTARFFSEEIDLWPKIGIMLAGQYVTYFFIILVAKKIVKLCRT